MATVVLIYYPETLTCWCVQKGNCVYMHVLVSGSCDSAYDMTRACTACHFCNSTARASSDLLISAFQQRGSNGDSHTIAWPSSSLEMEVSYTTRRPRNTQHFCALALPDWSIVPVIAQMTNEAGPGRNCISYSAGRHEPLRNGATQPLARFNRC